MELEEDDIYEVMLVNLRLATWLDLPEERKILADILLRSGVSEEIVKVWQQPHLSALQAEVAELHENLTSYEPIMQALPDVFKKGAIGTCCMKIMNKASEVAGERSSSNLNTQPN